MSKLFFYTLAVIGISCHIAYSARISNYERQIVASCLVLEAASDGVEGMRAVLNVIYNRSDHRTERVVRETIKRGQFSSMHSIWGQRTLITAPSSDGRREIACIPPQLNW